MGYIIKNGVSYIVYNGINYGGLDNGTFKIIGSTSEPTSPVENTIWIETDTTITSYIFSVKRPNTVSEGMVWFKTGSSSPVSFNAITNNYLEVNPLMCQQYINGAWTIKTTKTYQNGAWVNWSTYFYYMGEVDTTLSGGLTAYAYGPSTSESDRVLPTVEMGSNYMLIYDLDGTINGYDNGASTMFAENPIDLTGFNKLCCEVLEIVTENGNYIRLGITETKADNYVVPTAKTMRTTGVFEVDLTSVTGVYYPIINLYGSGDKSVKISRWWLE